MVEILSKKMSELQTSEEDGITETTDKLCS